MGEHTPAKRKYPTMCRNGWQWRPDQLSAIQRMIQQAVAHALAAYNTQLANNAPAGLPGPQGPPRTARPAGNDTLSGSNFFQITDLGFSNPGREESYGKRDTERGEELSKSTSKRYPEIPYRILELGHFRCHCSESNSLSGTAYEG